MQHRFIIFVVLICLLINSAFSIAKKQRPVLSASTVNLALSIQGLILNRIPSGQSRVITITNDGDVPATGLSIRYPTWPSGTSVNHSTCIQGETLAAGDSCTITVAPGTIATSGKNHIPCTMGIAPIPNVISVTADHTNKISISVIVLGYE